MAMPNLFNVRGLHLMPLRRGAAYFLTATVFLRFQRLDKFFD